MNIKFPPIYEEKNDFTSNKYDDTPTRFKTLYGAKVIQPYPKTMPSLSSFLTDCLLK